MLSVIVEAIYTLIRWYFQGKGQTSKKNDILVASP